MTIGEALKNHRVLQQMSQEEVATKILVTRTSISNWETGKTVPDSLNLLKLSTLYGCSVDELLKGASRNEKEFSYDDLWCWIERRNDAFEKLRLMPASFSHEGLKSKHPSI